MTCKCRGQFELSRKPNLAVGFEPYYDRVLRSWVTSSSDQEKKMNKHRSSSHPGGLYAVQDDKKFMAECRYIHKHREEWKEANWPGYKKGDGVYKPGRTDADRKHTVYI